MENKEFIGKKVKGFKFETEKDNLIMYEEVMDFFTDKIGTITQYCDKEDAYKVVFKETFVSDSWWYPAELIEQHIVEDTKIEKEPIYHNYFEFNPQPSEKEKEIVDSVEIKTPKHYDNSKGYDVIDIANDYKLNFNRGSAIKYICRAGKKDCEIKDLNKAIDFLQREIKFLELKNK